jgi:hypothetical protein
MPRTDPRQVRFRIQFTSLPSALDCCPLSQWLVLVRTVDETRRGLLDLAARPGEAEMPGISVETLHESPDDTRKKAGADT